MIGIASQVTLFDQAIKDQQKLSTVNIYNPADQILVYAGMYHWQQIYN